MDPVLALDVGTSIAWWRIFVVGHLNCPSSVIIADMSIVCWSLLVWYPISIRFSWWEHPNAQLYIQSYPIIQFTSYTSKLECPSYPILNIQKMLWTRRFDVPQPWDFEDFTVALPDGFPDHAHRGFLTLTYLLPSSPGDLSHEDFLGATSEGTKSNWRRLMKIGSLQNHDWNAQKMMNKWTNISNI